MKTKIETSALTPTARIDDGAGWTIRRPGCAAWTHLWMRERSSLTTEYVLAESAIRGHRVYWLAGYDADPIDVTDALIAEVRP